MSTIKNKKYKNKLKKNVWFCKADNQSNKVVIHVWNLNPKLISIYEINLKLINQYMKLNPKELQRWKTTNLERVWVRESIL